MKEEIKKEIKKLLALNEVSNPDSEHIEEIADCFPQMYSTEQEYINFQQEIAKMVQI